MEQQQSYTFVEAKKSYTFVVLILLLFTRILCFWGLDDRCNFFVFYIFNEISLLLAKSMPKILITNNFGPLIIIWYITCYMLEHILL